MAQDATLQLNSLILACWIVCLLTGWLAFWCAYFLTGVGFTWSLAYLVHLITWFTWSLKTHYFAYWRPSICEMSVNMTLSGLGVNSKVVNNGLFYLPLYFQPRRGISTRENDQKPSKMGKNSLKWPRICWRWAFQPKVVSHWSEQTLCQISKKSKKIFRGMTAWACLGTFLVQKQTFYPI